MIFFFPLLGHQWIHSRSSSYHHDIIFVFLLVCDSSCWSLFLFIDRPWYLQIWSISHTRGRYNLVLSFHTACAFLAFVALCLIVLVHIDAFQFISDQVIPCSLHAASGWSCAFLEHHLILVYFLALHVSLQAGKGCLIFLLLRLCIKIDDAIYILIWICMSGVGLFRGHVFLRFWGSLDVVLGFKDFV